MTVQIKFVQILNSPKPEKLYMARFYDPNRNLVKTTHFGSKIGRNYTHHGDNDIKDAWLSRHRVREDWDDATSPGALSRWLLWSFTSLSKSFKYYLKKFGYKEY